MLTLTLNALAQYDYDDEDLKKKPKTEQKKETPTSDKKFDLNKLSVGGYFGLSFGDIVFVDISPVAAYRLHKRVAVGAGVIYQYLNYKDYYPPPIDKSSNYGGRIFPRVFVWDELFAQLEYMVINGEVYYDNGTGFYQEARETFHNVFAGAGYNVPIGENSYFTILFSINLTENLLYPNRQPYISFGFGVGL